jgi:hypothetical protein
MKFYNLPCRCGGIIRIHGDHMYWITDCRGCQKTVSLYWTLENVLKYCDFKDVIVIID